MQFFYPGYMYLLNCVFGIFVCLFVLILSLLVINYFISETASCINAHTHIHTHRVMNLDAGFTLSM